MSEKIITATDDNFEKDILKDEGISLVDFWAEWCGPCRMLAPTIEEIAADYDGKVKVYKMNVDENPGTPGKYNIRGIPTVIVFKNGEAVDQLVGMQTKDAFVAALEKHLG